VHLNATRQKVRLEATVEIGAVHGGTDIPQAGKRGGRRMAVVVADPDRDERDDGPGRGEEVGRRGRGAPVVGDLEHVESRQPGGDERRIHVLLGVAGEQEVAP